MSDRTCLQCKKVFRYPSDLLAHGKRKTPCAPIVTKDMLPPKLRAKPHACRYCGRRYSAGAGLSRHVNKFCRIAKDDKGMEKLFEHTLQRQLDAQMKETSELREQVSELAGLLKQRCQVDTAVPRQTIEANGHAQLQVAQQGSTITNNHIQVLHFDAPQCIQVPMAMVRRLFVGGPEGPANPRLAEFLKKGELQENPDAAIPYVAEALVAITRECHKDPQQRNIYLSPKRADQVLVWSSPEEEKDGSWQVRTLKDALRHLFDCVAEQLDEVNAAGPAADDCKRALRGPGADPNPVRHSPEHWAQLMLRGAVGVIPKQYWGNVRACISEARAPMSARLENNRHEVTANGAGDSERLN